MTGKPAANRYITRCDAAGGRSGRPAAAHEGSASLLDQPQPQTQTLAQRVDDLAAAYHGLHGEALLRPILTREFPGRIALVSSFGTESAVLLQMVAAIDPALPILFIDTGKLFGETLRYRDELVARLGLRDIRTVRPAALKIAERDPDAMLWQKDPDACCYTRKVEPLAQALKSFDAWITGRKRYQGGARASLPTIEADAGFVKINPLAGMTFAEIEAAFEIHRLPRHPLEAEGFLSVGCYTCSARVASGGDRRSGRWQGSDKNECGIHESMLSAAL
jgi:phosphoadenosine phosphosulfate reductase